MLVAFQLRADHLKIRPNDATVHRQLFIKNSEFSGTNGNVGNGVLGFEQVRGKYGRNRHWGPACASNNSRLECFPQFLDVLAIIYGQNFHMSAGL